VPLEGAKEAALAAAVRFVIQYPILKARAIAGEPVSQFKQGEKLCDRSFPAVTSLRAWES
jgi:hypothetical protein